MDSRELIKALDLIEKEKGIDKEVIFEAIEASLVFACKKNYGTSDNIHVDINRETGEIKVFARKEVVEDEYDGFLEIALEDAKLINPAYEIGDFIDFEITPKNFGRISAQTAKQVVVQKIREAEREKIYNEFIQKEREIDTAIVQRTERKNVIVALGKYEAVLPLNEQIPGETYNFDDRIKVYIMEVRQTTKGPQITVSRTHYELVKRLFELEMPEVKDGTVEIKSIAREAGSRSKMAVYSQNESVDPVGACVGKNGARVNAVVNELKGEKIDIVPWNEDPKKFIASALNPAEVISVDIINEEEHSARVVVPDNQLSLAIGKEGQNVRLAAKLTGWKVDIKSQTQAKLLEEEEALAVPDDEELPDNTDTAEETVDEAVEEAAAETAEEASESVD
ncbi:MAG: transcription termination/antitermination protein NusA [Firmicutes bacterium]|nr:transcription termination/antitermination protein NusA [Bacillota bacterium]